MVTPLKLHNFPFSRRGSWMNLYRKNPATFYGGDSAAPLSLRLVAGTLWEQAEVLDLDLERAGVSVNWSEEIAPGLLQLKETDGPGLVSIAFQDVSTLRLRVTGVALRLILRRPKPLQFGGSVWGVRTGSCGWLIWTAVVGTLEAEKRVGAEAKDEAWTFLLNGETSAAEILLHSTSSAGIPPKPKGSLEHCARGVQADFESWAESFPQPPAEHRDLGRRELWNLWNLVVHPLGNFRREAILVSKGYLVGLWSWDHCWHMLAAAGIDPKLAWNNFMALFDHQDEHGALPDLMCANQLCWGILKPPVHGWMLGLLEQRYAWFGDEHRREIYPALARMTRFWLRERDGDGDGVPNYLDGCDCWDNATVFDRGFPMETPDLTTWLILQQEWLAKTARRLGLEEDAREWEAGIEVMLAKMLEHFWTGEQFVGRMSGTHEAVPSASLVLRVPLLLGSRLPDAARRWCLQGLLGGGCYRVPFGLLTEPRESPFFDADGYWRGPMWPVAVFIFVEALRSNGYAADATALAEDFLRNVASAGNFENYRGDTGAGVRDGSIAWTSTCVLSFLSDLAATRDTR